MSNHLTKRKKMKVVKWIIGIAVLIIAATKIKIQGEPAYKYLAAKAGINVG